MEQAYMVRQIGEIRAGAEGFRLELAPQYRAALTGLEGFSHINVLWWFSGCDNQEDRGNLREERPYAKGPQRLGVFSTRTPRRPNPIALSCAGITYLDVERGVVGLTYLDADDHSPVLDIKPYTPSLDRAEQASVPAWCSHWPKCLEESGDFDWEAEFHF